MTEPTTEQWRELHMSFRALCLAAPWQWLDDTDAVAIEHPSGDYTGYCAVMGSAGQEYGLAVFVGDEGLSGYMALMTDEVEPESKDALVRMNALSAMLADREDMDTRDRATIRRLGLRYRGRGKWPLFRATTPGFAPWYLDADEAAFLTTAIGNVMDVVSGVASGELALYSETDPSLILTRVFREGAWRDEWRPFKPPPPAAIPAYPDSERLHRLAQSQPMGQRVWEVSIFHIPMPTQNKPGTRPYYPTVVFAVDRTTGLILSTKILGAGPPVMERQGLLVELLETADVLPSEIVVDTATTARLVEPVTNLAGVRLSIGKTPALHEAKAELMAFMG